MENKSVVSVANSTLRARASNNIQMSIEEELQQADPPIEKASAILNELLNDEPGESCKLDEPDEPDDDVPSA